MLLLLFFFKQNTAYDLRISDWSSDVCSSDLIAARNSPPLDGAPLSGVDVLPILPLIDPMPRRMLLHQLRALPQVRAALRGCDLKIGRASSRDRVCQYVEISVVAVALKKNN